MAKSSSAFCYIEIKTVLPAPVMPTIAILICELSIVSKGRRNVVCYWSKSSSDGAALGTA